MSPSDVVILVGVALVTGGIALLSLPMAAIFVGLFAIVAGLVLARREAMAVTKRGGTHGSGELTMGKTRRGS